MSTACVDPPGRIKISSPTFTSPSSPSTSASAIFDALTFFRDGAFARDAHNTRSFTLWISSFAKPANCRESSCVGASTSARGLTARRCADGSPRRCVPFSSDCLRSWMSGRRYAIDLPEPVSDARRNWWYCEGSAGALESALRRCLSERAWMGVGRASEPSTSCSDARRPSMSGGDANSFGSSFVDTDRFETSNSSLSGLTTFGLLGVVGGVCSVRRGRVRVRD